MAGRTEARESVSHSGLRVHLAAFGGPPMKIEGKIEFTVTKQEQEQVISEMPVQSGILNPYGVVHAGAILWFADVTATILAMGSTQVGEGMSGFPLAINLNANFAGNQRTGTLRAVASFVKKGKTVSIVRTIVLGENDKMIADVSTNHVASK
jgi:uncharacterized protein (TIGR00369 family)